MGEKLLSTLELSSVIDLCPQRGNETLYAIGISVGRLVSNMAQSYHVEMPRTSSFTLGALVCHEGLF